MSPSRRSHLAFLALTVLASCKGEEPGCSPTEPGCNGGGAPTVAAIEVTSPVVDTVMAVGRTAQLSAAATSATGGSVSATFSWSSTVPATATVSTSGLVSAQAAGSTLIRASSGSVTGELPVRAVDADLPAVTAALQDALSAPLRAALSSAPGSTVDGLLAACASRVTAGNVLAIERCLTDLKSVAGTTGNDTALLAVLGLFSDHARRQLRL